jgi:alkaline phosphatase
VFRLNVIDPLNIQITGQFALLMSPLTDYPAGNRQRDLKLSAMAWVSSTKLLLLERSDEVDKGGVRLILADFSTATDLNSSSNPAVQTLDLEDANDPAKGIVGLDVTPAATTVLFQEFQTDTDRFFWTYKLEGLTILNKNQVALINDNDFGIVVADALTQMWVLRLAVQIQ